jgi:hypothetical protein
MRTFEKITSQRAESKDGVAIFSLDRFYVRYQCPEKYCDFYCEPFIGDDKQVAGLVISLKPRLGKHVMWHLHDGSTTSVTNSEINEIKKDLETAFATLGDRVKFG